MIVRRLADRQEPGERVDHALLDSRIDHDGLGRGVGERVAVRPGAGDDAQAEAAVGAGLVVHDDCWPRIGDISAASSRALMSLLPPGA